MAGGRQEVEVFQVQKMVLKNESQSRVQQIRKKNGGRKNHGRHGFRRENDKSQHCEDTNKENIPM